MKLQQTSINHQKTSMSLQETIAMFGEAMVEISDQPLIKGYGGDVLNTAIYLLRLDRKYSEPGDPECGDPRHGCLFNVQFITALGDDSLSEYLISAWHQEGLNTDFVERIKGKKPGLCMVETHSDGERSFHYWRDNSAARFYFQTSSNRLKEYLIDRQPDYFYLSGISLAIMTLEDRGAFLAILAQFKQQGGRIIFDNNYRPQLWAGPDEARSCYLDILALTDIAFLTDDDEKMVFGSPDPDLIIARCDSLGVKETVIKRGVKSCVVFANGEKNDVEGEKVDPVLDTCAAGAGYLYNRLSGGSIETAPKAGHRLASRVIQYRGAIIPEEFLWP